MRGPHATDYEAVRHALQERGYLEPPLERLFLGGADGVTGRRLWVSAVLSALIGGPLLGLLLAVVLVVQDNRAVPLWPDGVVYALLFAPVLGAAIAVAELAAAWVIRWRGRRRAIAPRTAAWVSGLAVAGVLGVYLGYWAMRGGAAIDADSLLALLAVSLAAGVAGRIVSAAALIEAALVGGHAPLERRRGWYRLFGAAGLIVALGAIAALAARRTEGPAVAVEDHYTGTGRRVLIGWDGFSRPLARGLVREGAVPWLASLANRQRPLSIASPTVSDRVALWTTLATGCDPSAHGLTGTSLHRLRGTTVPPTRSGLAAGPLAVLTRLLPLEVRPARAGVRQIPSLWEIAADVRKTAVIGWWATWPATSPGSAGGYVVSDAAWVATATARTIDRSIYPESWGAGRSAAWLQRAQAAAGARPPATAAAERVAWEALTTDLFLIEALRESLSDPDVTIALLYLPGLDLLRDRWDRQDRDTYELLAATRHHAALVDQALADTFGGSEGATAVTVVALPGRAGAREEGWWLGAATAGVPPDVARVELTTVAATWLDRMALTIDRRICDASQPGGPGRSSIPVLTRATPAKPAPTAEPFEQDVLERLRSLGYVE